MQFKSFVFKISTYIGREESGDVLSVSMYKNKTMIDVAKLLNINEHFFFFFF